MTRGERWLLRKNCPVYGLLAEREIHHRLRGSGRDHGILSPELSPADVHASSGVPLGGIGVVQNRPEYVTEPD